MQFFHPLSLIAFTLFGISRSFMPFWVSTQLWLQQGATQSTMLPAAFQHRLTKLYLWFQFLSPVSLESCITVNFKCSLITAVPGTNFFTDLYHVSKFNVSLKSIQQIQTRVPPDKTGVANFITRQNEKTANIYWMQKYAKYLLYCAFSLCYQQTVWSVLWLSIYKLEAKS